MNVNAGHERTSKARIIHQIQLIRGITRCFNHLCHLLTSCIVIGRHNIININTLLVRFAFAVDGVESPLIIHTGNEL
ncbi:hypothetical protein [Shigella dysenteriae]|uniref:hypothetical protein n=1 Tax=Shigella dysenteriae TaxID=622 RepID=UPI001493CB5E|nr:hypothetical protein [Shigella dysenteriae]